MIKWFFISLIICSQGVSWAENHRLSLVYEIILESDTIVLVAMDDHSVDGVIKQIKHITSSIPQIRIRIDPKSSHFHRGLNTYCQDYIKLDIREYQTYLQDHPFQIDDMEFPSLSDRSFYFLVDSTGVKRKEKRNLMAYDVVYSYVDHPPRFPGCMDQNSSGSDETACTQNKLFQFVQAEKGLNRKSTRLGLAGLVIIKFIVEKDGTISNVQVALRRHPILNQEALRIGQKLQTLPEKWTPAIRNGVPVRGWYELPIQF